MQKSDFFLAIVMAGLAGAYYNYLMLMYDGFKKVIPIKEFTASLTNIDRLAFLFMRLILGFLTAIIFSLWFHDDAFSGNISRSKLTFYLTVLCIGSTTLFDISKTVQQLFEKWLTNGS